MTINRQQTNTRQLKALTIVGQSDQIKRISTVNYKVKSQSSDIWYDIIHVYKQGWTCSCPDFIFRKVECKHIHAVYISKELRHKIVNNSDLKEIETNSELICKCGSNNIIKDGLRKNKSGTIQRFICKECEKEWSDNLGYS